MVCGLLIFLGIALGIGLYDYCNCESMIKSQLDISAIVQSEIQAKLDACRLLFANEGN
jgi:hypothetical protein